LKDLLDLSQETARKGGFPRIKFIAVTAGPMQENERAYGLPTVWKAKMLSVPGRVPPIRSVSFCRNIYHG